MSKTWHLAGWCLHFCTLGDHAAIQGHLGAQERRSWGPGFDFYRFGVDFGTSFWELFGDLWQTFVFFSMLVSRSLLLTILGLNLDVLGSRNKDLVWDVLQKPTFPRSLSSYDLKCNLSVFMVPWEQLFWFLLPWRQAWKLSVFFKVILGIQNGITE